MLIAGIGAQELLLIILAILILFGAKKIPELAQGLGKGIREFRRAVRDTKEEIEKPEEEAKSDQKKS
ncbi:MAG: preprotein translocase subunit TatA [candidate division Zixibacteria bacterium RBG_16_48_11]|nr:MAG: preprotein translocase subunit TatA [candidate division Zixibacteria bacterium RBG_16_48_11]